VTVAAVIVPREGKPVFLLSKMRRDILAVSDSWLRDGDVRIHRDGERAQRAAHRRRTPLRRRQSLERGRRLHP